MLQKPINYVFIDTSVFKREAYFKKTGGVSRLFELAANGWIRVLMPEIARREWWKHYSEAMRINFDEVERKAVLMGNTKEAGELVKAHKTIAKSYETLISESFEKHLLYACVEVLPNSYAQDTFDKVVDKYFAKEKPFGNKGKDKEFPDAFILSSLEKYAEDNSISKILLFSADKDMSEYNSRLFEIRELGDYLNDMMTNQIPLFEEEEKRMRDEKDIARMKSYLKENVRVFYSAIREHVESILSDTSIYSERFNYADIDEAYVEDIGIEASVKDIELLSVKEDEIRALYFVNIEAHVNVRHFNEDESIWDSEEKKYAYEAYSVSNIELSSHVMVTLAMDRMELQMDQDPKIKVQEIDTDDLIECINDNPRSAHQQSYTPIVDLQKFLQPLNSIQTMTNVSKVTNPMIVAQSSINVMQEAIKQMQIPQITEGLKQLSSLDIAMGDAVNIIKKYQMLPAINAFKSIGEILQNNGNWPLEIGGLPGCNR